MKKYYIKEDYIHRSEAGYFNDTPNTDKWQVEVYALAKTIFQKNNYERVLDIGTGSGYKLISNFKDHYTLGIDVPDTVNWLTNKYPDRNWSSDFSPVKGFDLIICADVIEHLENPDNLLKLIEESRPRHIVLSTPDRNLVYGYDHNGPPKNKSHLREWAFDEFKNYISTKFVILDHFITNKSQSTQAIVAALK